MIFNNYSNRKINIFTYIFMFVFIYSPSFFYNDKLNYALPFFYFLIAYFFYRHGNTHKNFIKTILKYTIYSSLFFIVRAIASGVSLTDFSNLRIVQSISFTLSVLTYIYIDDYFNYKGLSIKEKIDVLVIVCLIQFFFVLIMLWSPSLRIMILRHFYDNNLEGRFFTISKRVYGLMSNYTYAGSIFHGFVGFLLLYSEKNKINYFLYIPIQLLIVFLNARIGLIVFISNTVLFLIYILYKKRINAFLRLFSKLLFLYFISIIILPKVFPDTYRFFNNGFKEISSYVITGVASKTDNYSDLDKLSNQAKNNINFKSIIIGNGHRIKNIKAIPRSIKYKGSFSDMGFLNDMYMGGIIYMILLYYPFIKIVISKNSLSLNNDFNFFLLITMIICNLKGELFRSQMVMGIIVFSKFILNEYNRGSIVKNG